MIERLDSKEEVRQAVAEARHEGKTVGFVPTMGALHAGHLSLVQTARKRTDFVVVSVFVNPTQFGPGEDFAAYPRDLESDIELLEAEGVDLVFTPSVEEMYGPGAAGAAARTGSADTSALFTGASIDPGSLAERWEGEIRPGHFRGVATVVAKLLNILRPDLAFFGEKDYQQLVIVKRMVRDLDLPSLVVGCPIIRDADGLALSSRNAYLSPAERAAAMTLSRALDATAEVLAWGERSGQALSAVMRETVEAEDGAVLDYAAVVDPETLEPLEALTRTARALIAARIGPTRLIDTAALQPPPREEGA